MLLCNTFAISNGSCMLGFFIIVICLQRRSNLAFGLEWNLINLFWHPDHALIQDFQGNCIFDLPCLNPLLKELLGSLDNRIQPPRPPQPTGFHDVDGPAAPCLLLNLPIDLIGEVVGQLLAMRQPLSPLMLVAKFFFKLVTSPTRSMDQHLQSTSLRALVRPGDKSATVVLRRERFAPAQHLKPVFLKSQC
jgi:hypothetical protein